MQVDVAWVDDLLNRRIPAQTHVPHRDIEHAHTAGRDHAKLQPTVVDLDQIDALLLAAVQSALVDRPAGVAPVAREIGTRQLPALRVRVALGTCQNLIVWSRLSGSCDCQQTNGKKMFHGAGRRVAPARELPSANSWPTLPPTIYRHDYQNYLLPVPHLGCVILRVRVFGNV